jgi:hypothetical protein
MDLTRREALVGLAAMLPTLGGEPAPDPQPHGPSGAWRQVWGDDFLVDGPPDPDKWTRPDWRIQNVDHTDPDNAWAWGGDLVLRLSEAKVGALVRSRFQFLPGMVVEWRARFAGSDAGDPIWNWPALWTAGLRYPESGEHDAAEGLRRGLGITYWDRTKTKLPTIYPAGDWNNEFRTFTLWRGSTTARVYWAGREVARYPTDDDGGPQAILMSLGSTPRETPRLEKSSRMRVDYVRVWRR